MAPPLGAALTGPVGGCWKCGRALIEAEFGRQETCPGCRSDSKVCRNCVHYDERMNNECRESAAERVPEKTKSNFCDWFKPAFPKRTGGAASSEDSAKAAFDKLFKKKP